MTNETKEDRTFGEEKKPAGSFAEKLAEHFEEPLFAISIVGFLISLFRGFFAEFSVLLTAVLAMLGILSIYFIYLYFKSNKKNYYFIGIPVLLFLTALFSWYATNSSGFAARDNTAFSMIFGIFLLFYVIAVHKIMRFETAAIFAIFLSTLLVHLVPALSYSWNPVSGRFLAEITDPYYYYRHANYLVNNGYLPEVETMTYPGNPPRFTTFRLMDSLYIGSLTTVFNAFGLKTLDIAILSSGILAAFTAILLYLLVKELFSDFSPYNKIAAVLAAFMLISSPAFGSKAIATNPEDDAMGMFLLVSSFFLFVASVRRKNFTLSILAGFSFLLLNLTWSGYDYAVVTVGLFSFFYAIAKFIHNESCVEHIPYMVILFFISQLSPLILHAQGDMPGFSISDKSLLLSFFSPLVFSFFLELVRSKLYGKLEIKGDGHEQKVERFLQKNNLSISIAIVLVGCFFLIAPLVFPNLGFGISPSSAFNYVLNMIKGAKVTAIIPQTTAEQSPLCGSLNSDCLKEINNKLGISALFGLGMIPFLVYFIFIKKKSFGAIFVLCWSLPILWGVINKVQYQFTASVPVIALGSTIGLVLAIRIKDLQGLRAVPSIVFALVILFLSLFQGSILLFGPFGGSTPMYMGYNAEALFWDPTLQWLKANTDKDKTEILTWWDYGHIITAVAERKSILDNVKGDAMMVQDVAKFHVLVDNEADALKIAKKYNSTHVIIDWTMIGKSAAPHFIATSNVTAPVGTPNREGEREGYSQCGFSPTNSMLKAQPTANEEGGFDLVQKLVFFCSISGPYTEYIGAISFDIRNEKIYSIDVYPIVENAAGGMALDAPIKWDLWKKEKGGAILGIQSLGNVLGNALNYGTDKYADFSTFTNLIFVPKKFENYMMTKLYLGDHLDEYKQLGLADLEKPEYFELVDGFLGDKQDNSYYGYVRLYKINYPAENGSASNPTTGFQ